MLVERILCRESLRRPKLPVPIGHKRRGDGERTQRERAEPTPASRQDGDGRDELKSKHRDRKRHRRGETEVIHLGEGFVENHQLHDATLQVRGTEPKQGNPSHRRRGESRQSVVNALMSLPFRMPSRRSRSRPIVRTLAYADAHRGSRGALHVAYLTPPPTLLLLQPDSDSRRSN
jgi:hypothetical protein